MSTRLRTVTQNILKDGTGVVFDDDTDREDFEKSILKHGDLDAQLDKLSGERVNRPTNPKASLKETEREAYWEDQFHQPIATHNFPSSLMSPEITYVEDTPMTFNKRTHNQIRLIQQNNASMSRISNMYRARFK